MALLIDSSPDCVVNKEGATPADDIADFIVGDRYQDCAGFMTFGPGSTYGDEGAGAAGSYMILTWLGIAVMVGAFVLWMIVENRTLVTYALKNPLGPRDAAPQPSVTRGGNDG